MIGDLEDSRLRFTSATRRCPFSVNLRGNAGIPAGELSHNNELKSSTQRRKGAKTLRTGWVWPDSALTKRDWRDSATALFSLAPLRLLRVFALNPHCIDTAAAFAPARMPALVRLRESVHRRVKVP